MYVQLIKDLTPAQRKANAQVQKFCLTEAGGWLRTLYEADGSRRTKYVHPTRRAIEQDVLFERFDPRRLRTT